MVGSVRALKVKKVMFPIAPRTAEDIQNMTSTENLLFGLKDRRRHIILTSNYTQAQRPDTLLLHCTSSSFILNKCFRAKKARHGNETSRQRRTRSSGDGRSDQAYQPAPKQLRGDGQHGLGRTLLGKGELKGIRNWRVLVIGKQNILHAFEQMAIGKWNAIERKDQEK